MTETFRVLSFGAGVQSSALLVASCEGVFTRPDVAIFADTHAEPDGTMAHLDYMTTYAKRHGVEIATVSAGDLGKDALGDHGRFASIPLITKAPDGTLGRLHRQCTQEYKIEPIAREIRRRLGYRPRQRITRPVELWLGISTVEVHRVKPSRIPWQTHRWPLIELEMSRAACRRLLEQHDIPVPQKSSCVFCPYHSNRYFLDQKRERPAEWQQAVAFDEAVRRVNEKTGTNKVAHPLYVHRSGEPLARVYLNEDQLELFGEECSGYCEA